MHGNCISPYIWCDVFFEAHNFYHKFKNVCLKLCILNGPILWCKKWPHFETTMRLWKWTWITCKTKIDHDRLKWTITMKNWRLKENDEIIFEVRKKKNSSIIFYLSLCARSFGLLILRFTCAYAYVQRDPQIWLVLCIIIKDPFFRTIYTTTTLGIFCKHIFCVY